MNKPLILLHGALGSGAVFEPLIEPCFDGFETHKINFSGHGGSKIPDAPFSIPRFADQLSTYILSKNLQPADIFGYSMGGYVALHLASIKPELIKRIFTLGTKFDWNEETANKEASQLEPEQLEEKLPAFAKQLKELHAPADWKHVARKTMDMMRSLAANHMTAEDFSKVNCEVLLAVGDRDKMVSHLETKQTVNLLPNATFRILENTPHPLERADRKILSQVIAQFFS